MKDKCNYCSSKLYLYLIITFTNTLFFYLFFRHRKKSVIVTNVITYTWECYTFFSNFLSLSSSFSFFSSFLGRSSWLLIFPSSFSFYAKKWTNFLRNRKNTRRRMKNRIDKKPISILTWRNVCVCQFTVSDLEIDRKTKCSMLFCLQIWQKKNIFLRRKKIWYIFNLKFNIKWMICRLLQP